MKIVTRALLENNRSSTADAEYASPIYKANDSSAGSVAPDNIAINNSRFVYC